MTQSPCRVCGATRTGAFAEKDGYAYTRCAACGFVFLDPMPGAAELARQYMAEDGTIDADSPPAVRPSPSPAP